MTTLRLPSDVSYPVTINALLVGNAHAKPAANSEIARTTPLYTFSFDRVLPHAATASKGKDREVTHYTRVYESPIEGQLVKWHVTEGQVLHKNQAILDIQEPCTHPVQLEGLCAICGKDLTATDFLGYSDTARATISMSHHHSALTVSQEEAERLEAQTTSRLLSTKKLSLIVDLDQTVVHATVDPTVGEWLDDEKNPNHSALKDVAKFKLGMDGSAVKDNQEGCWYYIKPRPGLRSFLDRMTQCYEMHVYTMGTRTYAEAVCKGIDPDGKYFGGRILSRDESGSLTQKSLRRLFPCDTSMVVIIDDRADVWEWSPNLLKVVPFDFYVGIGDINAAFLPKKGDVEQALNSAPKKAAIDEGPDSPPYESLASTPSSVEAAPSQSKLEATSVVLSNQIAERPLQQAQAKMEEKHKQDVENGHEDKSADDSTVVVSQESFKTTEEAVLQEDDHELDRVEILLEAVHARFFELKNKGKVADVKHIIPAMKRKVLKDVKLLFSSVIPLGTDPAHSEIWKLAESFGATCFHDLQPLITHVVAGREGTVKVNAARKYPKINVVWTSWLLESMALWQRLDEKDYVMKGEGDDQSQAEDRLGELSTDIALSAGDDSANIDLEAIVESTKTTEEDINWADADAELDAFLMESDDESRPSTPNRKRSRSQSPSVNGEEEPKTAKEPASPLSKRQKMAARRTSKLKISFSEPEDATQKPLDVSQSTNGSVDSEDDDFLDNMAAELTSEV